jgi:hypothetical protein
MLRASLIVLAAAVAASSVTGSGTITFGTSVERVSVNASGSTGRATFTDRTASGTVTGTIDINCVRIAGNEATLSGIVTESNRPELRGQEALFQIRDLGNGKARGRDDKGEHNGDDKGKKEGWNKGDDDSHGKGNGKNGVADMMSPILFHAVGTGSNCQIPGEFDLVPVKGDFTVRP